MRTAAQVLVGQVGLAAPVFDIGLDEIEARALDGGHGLHAEELRVVLAEDAAAEEAEQEAHVAVEARSAEFDDQGIRQTALFQDGVDDPAHDAEVELEPPCTVERFERGELSARGQPTDELEQGLFQLGGHRPVALFGSGERFRRDCFGAKASLRGAPHRVPVEKQ
jgi:hypothetical protein